MANSRFPFFFLIVQIGMPVNEVESLAHFLSLHQMRINVGGLSHAKDIAKKDRKILLLSGSSVILNSFFPFPMNKTQCHSPKPTQEDGRSRKETRKGIPDFRRGPGRTGLMKERP
jgi:hypothetical protein